jgi:hypothetical protein
MKKEIFSSLYYKKVVGNLHPRIFKIALSGLFLVLLMINSSNASAVDRYIFLGYRDSGGQIEYYLDTQQSKFAGSEEAYVAIYQKPVQMPTGGGIDFYIYNFNNKTAQYYRGVTLSNGQIVYRDENRGSVSKVESEGENQFYFYDKIYAYFHNGSINNNSQPPQQAGEPPKPVSSSNTVTKFPQQMGNMHLVLARPIKQGIYSEDTDLLSGQSGIRCIVVSRPDTFDGGWIRFKLDNGKYVGISLSFDGKLFFEGDGCQPRRIEGGVLTKYKDEQGFFGKMRFDGGVALGAFDDGKLHVGFFSNHGSRDFTVELPPDAHYLTGIVDVAYITNAEVAFYK